jgi:hypothetical protein
MAATSAAACRIVNPRIKGMSEPSTAAATDTDPRRPVWLEPAAALGSRMDVTVKA